MSKKIIALLLAVIAIAVMSVLVSCGGDDAEETSAPDATTAAETTVAETVSTEETTVAEVTTAEEVTTIAEVTTAEATTAAEVTTEEDTEPAETEPEGGIYDPTQEKAQFVSVSFDECEAWNGDTELSKLFSPGHHEELTNVADVDGSATAIRFWGWFATKADAVAIGYKIDDLAPVFGDFFYSFDAVLEALGGNLPEGATYGTRFNIFADISELNAGKHTIKAIYKLADGTKVCFAQVEINIGYRVPKLGPSAMSFTASAADEQNGKSLDATNLAKFFNVELPLGGAQVETSEFVLGGISDLYATMDGEYIYQIEVTHMDKNVGDGGVFVRGYHVIHTPDITEPTKDGYYPISNHYETDGRGGAGGSGILVSLKPGELKVFINAYDSTNPEKVQKIPFVFDLTGIEESNVLTFLDMDNVVSIYVGSTLVTTVTLSGWTQYEDIITVGADIHFAKTAVIVDANGVPQTVEDTLVVDNAASELGVVGRSSVVKFPFISVSAPADTILVYNAETPGGRWLNDSDSHVGETPEGGAKAWFTGWIGTTDEDWSRYKIGMYLKDTEFRIEHTFEDCITNSEDADAVQAAAELNGASYSARFTIEECFPMAERPAGEYTVVCYLSNGLGQYIEICEFKFTKA